MNLFDEHTPARPAQRVSAPYSTDLTGKIVPVRTCPCHGKKTPIIIDRPCEDRLFVLVFDNAVLAKHFMRQIGRVNYELVTIRDQHKFMTMVAKANLRLMLNPRNNPSENTMTWAEVILHE